MSGGKGKSHGGKAGPKGADGSRQQVSHSAKAGLQVRNSLFLHGCCVRVFGNERTRLELENFEPESNG